MAEKPLFTFRIDPEAAREAKEKKLFMIEHLEYPKWSTKYRDYGCKARYFNSKYWNVESLSYLLELYAPESGESHVLLDWIQDNILYMENRPNFERWLSKLKRPHIHEFPLGSVCRMTSNFSADSPNERLLNPIVRVISRVDGDSFFPWESPMVLVRPVVLVDEDPAIVFEMTEKDLERLQVDDESLDRFAFTEFIRCLRQALQHERDRYQAIAKETTSILEILFRRLLSYQNVNRNKSISMRLPPTLADTEVLPRLPFQKKRHNYVCDVDIDQLKEFLRLGDDVALVEIDEIVELPAGVSRGKCVSRTRQVFVPTAMRVTWNNLEAKLIVHCFVRLAQR